MLASDDESIMPLEERCCVYRVMLAFRSSATPSQTIHAPKP